MQPEDVGEGELDRAEPKIVDPGGQIEQCPPPARVPLDDSLRDQQVRDVVGVTHTGGADDHVPEVRDGGAVPRRQLDVVERH